MIVYIRLDDKNRIRDVTYNEITIPELASQYLKVDIPDDHPIVSLGRVNYRYVPPSTTSASEDSPGEWVEDNSLRAELDAKQNINRDEILDAKVELKAINILMDLGVI